MNPELTPERVTAILIVRSRKLLVLGMIDRLMENREAEIQHEAEFARVFSMLPLALRINSGDKRRVSDPAIRRLKRLGVLDAHEWATK